MSDNQSAPTPAHETTVPKRKLGRIGGKQDMNANAEKPSGMINGTRSDDIYSSSVAQHRKTSPPEPPVASTTAKQKIASPLAHESLDVAADKKREELKRKLQAQEQAHGKRKRRF